MKKRLLPLIDKLLLHKRAIIKGVIDQLKNVSHLEHTASSQPDQLLHQYHRRSDRLLAAAEAASFEPLPG